MELLLLVLCLGAAASGQECSNWNSASGQAESDNNYDDAIRLDVHCNETELAASLSSEVPYIFVRLDLIFECYNQLNSEVQNGTLLKEGKNFAASKRYIQDLNSSLMLCRVELSYVDEDSIGGARSIHACAMCSTLQQSQDVISVSVTSTMNLAETMIPSPSHTTLESQDVTITTPMKLSETMIPFPSHTIDELLIPTNTLITSVHINTISTIHSFESSDISPNHTPLATNIPDAEDKVHTIVGIAILGTTLCMCGLMATGAFLFYKRHKKDEFKEVQHTYYSTFDELQKDFEPFKSPPVSMSMESIGTVVYPMGQYPDGNTIQKEIIKCDEDRTMSSLDFPGSYVSTVCNCECCQHEGSNKLKSVNATCRASKIPQSWQHHT